jgi:hypothetical protein
MTNTTAHETPAELLANHVVLTPGQVATVLQLHFTKGAKRGEPDRSRVVELVRTGVLAPIDPSQPVARWTFSVNSIRRYLEQAAA